MIRYRRQVANVMQERLLKFVTGATIKDRDKHLSKYTLHCYKLYSQQNTILDSGSLYGMPASNIIIRCVQNIEEQCETIDCFNGEMGDMPL